jgi:alpha-tubulin suppressor-like RCC1 family protein
MKWFITLILFVWQPLAFAASPSGYVIGWGVNVSGEATGMSSSFIYTNHGVIDEANYYGTGVVMVAGQALKNIVAISTGMSHSLALRSDGKVVGFGDNMFGKAIGVTNEYPYRASRQVSVGGHILNNAISIAAGRDFSLALKVDGTVTAWGKTSVPDGLSNVVAIAAREFNSLALKNDGTVIGWTSAPGSQTYGQLYEFAGLSNVVAIAEGGGGDGTWNTALKKDGTLVVWRNVVSEPEMVPDEVANVMAIAAGAIHTLALKSDGTVIGFGYNGDGQATGIPTHQAADDPHLSCGLVKIGGQTLSNVVSVAAYGDYSLALKNDGTVLAWGHHFPPVPAGLSNVVAISAGDNFCLAITTNKAVAEKFSAK